MILDFGLRIALLMLGWSKVRASNSDRFNYRQTTGNDYGPEDWADVECSDVGDCSGWPDGWELGIGWELEENNCQWCPDTGNDCGIHRQSPIDLERAPSTTGHDPDCIDYHWMAYQDGSCNWHDIIKNGYSIDENNFKIQRHSLQILQPLDDDGVLQCDDSILGRRFPRLDYSKGFPDWWFLSHTEVTVPSEHTQDGKRYDAEVHLSHFYSVEHERHIGKVAIFMEADPSQPRWPFLDKLICQWREVEEEVRDECGLESVPPYHGCRNPSRAAGETDLPQVDPYPFIDCDSVVNAPRICKPTSCCEAERSTTEYCENDVYGFYGEDTVGSICWWCCPNKLLARLDGNGNPTNPPTDPPAPNPTSPPTPPPFTNPTSPPTPPSVTDPTSPPTPPPVTNPTAPPTPPPVTSPTTPPTPPPVTSPPTDPPVTNPYFPSTCEDYNSLMNVDRICKDGGCCDSTRSATDHCHKAYKLFGADMGHLCSDCCTPSKQMAPPPPPHPTFPPFDCTLASNPYRMCKPNSCCEEERSTSAYCQSNYNTHGDDIFSICWYCCSEPKEVGGSTNPYRRLGAPVKGTDRGDLHEESLGDDTSDASKPESLSEIWGSNPILGPENFVPTENAEEEHVRRLKEYQERQKESRAQQEEQGRRLESGDNYANVPYSPYEWLREVATEYYFRYEGSQMVPPCYETVHYRVMKDPIRIHPDQLAELERLLAKRIAPLGSGSNECQSDTAGKARPGSNGDAVDLNRPLQSYHNIHRKVFCECIDWDSKFEEDIEWCLLNENEKLSQPYNFPSNGYEL